MKTLNITKHSGGKGARDFLSTPFWLAASIFALIAAAIDGNSSVSLDDEK